MTDSELDDNLIQARSKMVEAIERGTETYGMRSSMARVYSHLFLAEDARSFEELVDATGDGEPTVNDALHGLQQLQLVEETTSSSGDVAFTTTKSSGEVMRSEFPAAIGDGLDDMIVVLDDATSDLDAEDGEEAEVLLERADDLEGHLRFTKSVLDQYTALPDDVITNAMSTSMGDDDT